MEYTVQRLGSLAGVSTRTLRYYDVIDLLKPARINSSGYRIYGQSEVDRLQQILFYRELGVSLENIKELMTASTFDGEQALREHREKLLDKRQQLDLLIANLDKTLAQTEGRMTMTNKERFEGFKQKLIDDNEVKYGKEVRNKYGDEQVNKSNQKVKNMTEVQHSQVEKLGADVIARLAEAFATGDPAGELAQKTADLHHQWLNFYCNNYSKEAHAGLAQMYVDNEKFTTFYDANQPSSAIFLRDAVLIYTAKSI